jgi:phospholipid transport system substrate-binding protein
LYSERVGWRLGLRMLAASLSAIITLTTAMTAWAGSPGEAVVRGAIESMRALPATKGHPAARRKVLDSIDNSLALDLLAKEALGPQWAKLNDAERRRFVALLTESLEKLGYPRGAEALSQVKVTYLGGERTASTEVVKTTIGDDGNDSGGRMPLDFAVARRGSRWQIVDVAMNGMSLSRVVSTRVQDTLAKDGYQKLVEELQRQVAAAGDDN